MNFNKLFIFFILSVGLISFFVIIIFYSGLFFYNPTPSLPYGLYIKCLFNKNLTTGSLVVFKNPSTLTNSQKRLIKRIDKIDGDYLFVTGDNSQTIFDRCKVDNLISYDSYIFGLVPKNNVVKVRPFITWNKLL